MKPTFPLIAVSFFAADVQAGVGPFLGIYLLANGWTSEKIGTVLTIAGIVGMLVTAPAGASTPPRAAAASWPRAAR